MRKGVNNFFHNITTPIRFANCLLQGEKKIRSAEAKFACFIMNTIIGVLGFGDPASKYPELNPEAEDFGQTLGKYGIGNGIYIVIVWSFLGSPTLER